MANELYQRIVDDVIAEREKQRGLWSAEHDGRHDALQWAGLLTRYIGRAVDAGEAGATVGYRANLVKAAAVSLAALESFDIVMAGMDAVEVERYGLDPGAEALPR